MPYTLSREPNYRREAVSILRNVLNGKSVKDEECSADGRKRDEALISAVKQYFEHSISLETYVKENINLNLPGYETNGTEMANFLFQGGERLDAPPIHVILLYDRMLEKGIDNKKFAFFTCISDYVEDFSIWSKNESNLSESGFFNELDKHLQDLEEKYIALKLYHNFDTYREYANALVQQVEALVKSQTHKFESGINKCVDFWHSQLEQKGLEIFKEMFNFSVVDDNDYTIYPGMYAVGNISLILSGGTLPPVVIIGIHCAEISDAIKSLESTKDIAIDFLKALSDKTKLKILHILKKDPRYGNQLAEELKCTSANISHHISELLRLGIVYGEKENNKVYFYLDTEKIEQRFDEAKGLFI